MKKEEKLSSEVAFIGFLGWLIAILLCASGAVAEEKPEAEPSTEVEGAPEEPQAGEPAEPPQITPGPVLTLSQALEQTQRRNLDLAAAKLEVEKAEAGFSKSLGLLLPIVIGKMDYTHMDHADTVDLASSFQPFLDAMGMTLPPGTSLGDPLLVNPQENLTGAIQAMLPLINAQNWFNIGAAKRGVRVAELSVEQANRQVLLGVAKVYITALTTRDLIDFYHSQVVTAKEQRRVAAARFKAGKGMRIDVIRAETDLEQASQSLLSAQLAFDNVRDVLGQLIGNDGLPMPVGVSTLKAPEGSADTLERRAGSLRVDIEVESAKADLAKQQLDAAWMQFVPTLDFAWQGSYKFTEMADLGSDDRTRWAAMLSLTVPIYNHFRYAELDEKRAALRQANIVLANTEKKAALDVRKARRDYAVTLTSVAKAEKQAALAEEGLKLTEASYRAGTGTSLDVTQARQTHTAAGFNLATSQLNAQLALLTLLDAVGENLTTSIADSEKEIR